MRGNFPASGLLTVLALAAAAVGVADPAAAAPYCYDTGPGHQKCVDGSTGGYFDPIYQGPKVYEGGNLPWVPTAPPPVYVPVPPAAAVPDERVQLVLLGNQVQTDIQRFFDDPANGRAQYSLHFGLVTLARTGADTFGGTVAVSTADGLTQNVPLTVAVDPAGNMTWHLDPAGELR